MTTSEQEYSLTDMSDAEVDECLDMLAEKFEASGRGWIEGEEDAGEDGTI